MNVEIFSRLREERLRLGFRRQDALAEKIGASPSSVHNYEVGKSSPDADYLVRFMELGADVLYILTGTRQGERMALGLPEGVAPFARRAEDARPQIGEIAGICARMSDEGLAQMKNYALFTAQQFPLAAGDPPLKQTAS